MNDMTTFDVEKIRKDFPIFGREVHGKPLAFLDSGASAQKPTVVLEAIEKAYSETYANVHRGVHYLSQVSTDLYEGARETVRAHLNAASVEEIIFTKNATESINLVAYSYGWTNLKPGDEILLSTLEHHSNIVPWQLIAEKTGAVVKAVPIDAHGEFMMEAYHDMLGVRRCWKPCRRFWAAAIWSGGSPSKRQPMPRAIRNSRPGHRRLCRPSALAPRLTI